MQKLVGFTLTAGLLFTLACGSTQTPTLSVPFLSARPAADSPIRAKRMEFARFELDWDGMKPLGSRPKQEVRTKLLASIENDCPNYQVVNEGEKAEETQDQQEDAVQQNAKIVRNYYWIRYRCGDGS